MFCDIYELASLKQEILLLLLLYNKKQAISSLFFVTIITGEGVMVSFIIYNAMDRPPPTSCRHSMLLKALQLLEEDDQRYLGCT